MRLNFQMLSVGMLANDALFFLALRLDKENLSRGVLYASMLWLLGIIVVKFSDGVVLPDRGRSFGRSAWNQSDQSHF